MKLISSGYAANLVLICTIFAATDPSQLHGQTERVPPGWFGLQVSGKIVTPSKTQKAQLEPSGQVVEVIAKVGNDRIVLVPSGEIKTVTKQASPLSTEPFRPLSSNQLASRLRSEFPGFQLKVTPHFLIAYDSSERFAFGTSRILESQFNALMKYGESLRLEQVHPPRFPLVVVLFAREAEFRKHAKNRSVLAFYDTLTNRVLAFEEPAGKVTDRPKLERRAIATIGHEGVHQVFNNIGIQQRLSVWPQWIAEGMAEYFAPTSLSADLKWNGAGRINQARLAELSQLFRDGQQTEQLVRNTIAAQRLTSAGYASAWALTHFLYKYERKQLHDYLRKMASLQPLEAVSVTSTRGVVKQQVTTFESHFGRTSVLEKRFSQYVQRMLKTRER